MAISLLLVELLTVLLLFIPGYITYSLLSNIGKVEFGEDNLEKTLLIIIFGLLCNSIFIIIYSLWKGNQPDVSSIELKSFTLLELSLIYVSLIVISIGTGIILGIIIDRIYLRNSLRRREDVWDISFYLSNSSGKNSIEATVITDQGKEIHGYILARGTSDDSRDILVKYPTVDGSSNPDIGDRVYINGYHISELYFEQTEG